MPTYTIQDPQSGKSIKLTGDSPPTEAELTEIFSKLNGPARTPDRPTGLATIADFAGGAWQNLNPMAMAEGVVNAVRHPIDTARNVVNAQVDQGRQALDLAKEGRYSEAAGHGLAAALPLVGPAAAEAGEDIRAGLEGQSDGNVARGLGKATGLLVPFGAERALEGRVASNAAKRAPMLEREARDIVSQRVLGPANPAYRGKASALAPQILERGLKGGRDELRQAAVEGMADSGAAVDAAIAADFGPGALIAASDVVNGLRQRIAALQDSKGQPLSGEAAARINALSDRITQIQSLGGRSGQVAFDDLRKLRDENYRLADEARGYEQRGNPVKSDEGWAARETGSVIRDVFAKKSPNTAAANADFTFWKSLNDVLDPNKGRPKSTAAPSGVTGGQRTVGAVVGNIAGGKAGAFVLSTVLPWVRDQMAGPGWQLASAQSKMQLAEGLRRGDIGRMKWAMLKVEQSQAQRTTSPNESLVTP